MHWTVAAPFINKHNLNNEFWLTKYVPGNRHQFDIIPRQEPLDNWHNRKSSVSGFKDWLQYWQHGKEALKHTKGGAITLFPQLPSVIGWQKYMTSKQIPVVAWQFSVGYCYGGMKRRLAQLSLNHIDHFVVHSKREIDIYHKWLGIPLERLGFVPLHEKELPVTAQENTTNPFIAALGSAYRDFPTLFQAVSKLDIPTVVASGSRSLDGLTIPPQVKVPLGIDRRECLCIAQEARINVVPLLPKPEAIAAGMITIVEAMHMGRAVIATRCLGAEDYIIDGETGLLVEPHSVEELMYAIKTLWQDSALRARLGQQAKRYAEEHFSGKAAGVALGRILDKVADKACG